MRFGSVCSGIEAASVAWHPLGWRAAWLSEIAPFPSAVLAHHYPDVPNLGDMTAIDVNEQTANIDVLIGGTPCQAFSVAGLRKSLDDERGNLSLAFCRLARRIAEFGRLKFVVWENVPGVLSTKDNAFGCFLAGLVGEPVPLRPAGPKWTHAGCVYGPEGSAAWRILDAQYLALAQRRKRVFVVFCPGGWADPAQILFEWEGVRRDSPPRRETGERTAGTIASRTTAGGGLGTDFECDGGLTVTHTHTQELSRCLNAGGMGRQDYETETLIPVTGGGFDDVALPLTTNVYCDRESEESGLIVHSLRAEGFDASEDGTGRGTPIVPILEVGKGSSSRGAGPNGCGIGKAGDPMFTLQAGAQHAVGVPIPIDMLQASRGEMMTNNRRDGKCSGGAPGTGIGEPGDPAPSLSVSHTPAVAIQERAVSDNPMNGPQGKGYQQEIAYTLEARHHVQAVAKYGVRRLTPVECERLMGFPDGYTAIEYRGKPAADSNRYQSLGNSMAVPVIRWIGERLQLACKHHSSYRTQPDQGQ